MLPVVEAIVVELSDKAVRDLGVQWLMAGEQGVGLTNYSDRAAPLVPIAGGAAAGQLDKDDPLRERLQNLALKSLLGANGFVGGAGGIDDGGKPREYPVRGRPHPLSARLL